MNEANSNNGSARDCIAELVSTIMHGTGFVSPDDNEGVGWQVVDSELSGYLTIDAAGFLPVLNSQSPRVDHVWAEVVSSICDSAAPWCKDTGIASLAYGRVMFRVPDADAAAFLLRYVKAYYASPVRGIKEFAANYQP